MKQLLISGFTLYLLALIACPPVAGAESLDKIVAVAGNDVILQSELDNAVNLARAQSNGRADRMPRDVLRSQVLDRLIMRQLQVERAKQHHISASDAEIKAGMARLAKQNGMGPDQFLRAVAASGMSHKQMRDKVRDQILVSKLRRQQVLSKVSVNDGDIDRYLENESLQEPQKQAYRLRHILIEIPDDADPASVAAARERINALRRRVVNGDTDFAAAARANSQGQSAGQGGQLGWIDGAYMPRTFAQVVPGMQPGQVSKVFRGPSGFHLVQLEDVRAGGAADTGPKVMVREVRAQHILLKPNEIRNAQRTRKLAEQIHQRLAAGDDFSALAKKYSDDKATAHQGGELGWLVPKRLSDAIQKHLQNTSAGHTSAVFQTPQGYEIVKVEAKRRRDQTREAARARARKALGEQKAQEEGQRWLRRLRDESYVDIRMKDYHPSGGS